MFWLFKRKRKPKRNVRPRVRREKEPAPRQQEPVSRQRELRPRQRELKRELAGVFILGLAALTFISLAVQESGAFGMSVRKYFFAFAGEKGAFFLPLMIAAVGWQMVRRPQEVTFSSRFWGFIIFCFWWILVFYMLTESLPVSAPLPVWYSARGGFLGGVILFGLYRVFSFCGTLIILSLLMVVALVLMLNRPLVQAFKDMFRVLGEPFRREPPKPEKKRSHPRVAEPAATVETEPGTHLRTSKKAVENYAPALDISGQAGRKLGPYHLPPLDLLQPSTRFRRGVRSLDQSEQLEKTLAAFGVAARVIDVFQGPVITRYDLQPAPGVKVSRIVNLADDLALALAARGLRIEAPIPGKAAVGIEVPNKEPRTVTLREVLETKEFWETGKLGVALGVDIAGAPVVASLDQMPHLLVAGATGSGKSVCLNALILSLLYKASPVEVKLIMVDPKRVELSAYEGIPHLSVPVVTEAEKAAAVLRAVVAEMEKRYKLFAERGVRDLPRFNQTLKKDEAPLPYVVVFIDELADLMAVAPVEVEDAICRLAQMARATGIHLVVATQRPSVDVITGLIKANIPSRIAFAVSSQVDSRTILDCTGAEHLLGRGDMLYSPVGALKPQRVQGALVLDEEIKKVTEFWRAQGSPDYVEAFLKAERIEPAGKVRGGEEDELFWEAVKLVVEQGQASASTLQRRFRIGYTRAARLVDMMEERGFVSPREGSKPRDVLISPRRLEELLKENSLEK